MPILSETSIYSVLNSKSDQQGNVYVVRDKLGEHHIRERVDAILERRSTARTSTQTKPVHYSKAGITLNMLVQKQIKEVYRNDMKCLLVIQMSDKDEKSYITIDKASRVIYGTPHSFPITALTILAMQEEPKFREIVENIIENTTTCDEICVEDMSLFMDDLDYRFLNNYKEWVIVHDDSSKNEYHYHLDEYTADPLFCTGKPKKTISQSFREKVVTGCYNVLGLSLDLDPEKEWRNYEVTPLCESLIKSWSRKLKKVVERMDEGLTGKEAAGNYINALLVGRPGCGKSVMIKAICSALGLSYLVQTGNADSEASDLTEKIIVSPTEGSQFTVVMTKVLYAATYGGMLVLEEINLWNPNILFSVLTLLLAEPYCIHRANGTTIQRHPLCVVVATMNPEAVGAFRLNAALISRFSSGGVYMMEDLEENVFIQALEKKHYIEDEKINKKACRWVYDAYKRVLNHLESSQEDSSEVTMRACEGALDRISEGIPPLSAIRSTILGCVAATDISLYAELETEVLPDLRKVDFFVEEIDDVGEEDTCKETTDSNTEDLSVDAKKETM